MCGNLFVLPEIGIIRVTTYPLVWVECCLLSLDSRYAFLRTNYIGSKQSSTRTASNAFSRPRLRSCYSLGLGLMHSVYWSWSCIGSVGLGLLQHHIVASRLYIFSWSCSWSWSWSFGLIATGNTQCASLEFKLYKHDSDCNSTFSERVRRDFSSECEVWNHAHAQRYKSRVAQVWTIYFLIRS